MYSFFSYLSLSWWITYSLCGVVTLFACLTDGLLVELNVALLAVVLAAHLLCGGGVGRHVGHVALGVGLVNTLLDGNLLNTWTLIALVGTH